MNEREQCARTNVVYVQSSLSFSPGNTYTTTVIMFGKNILKKVGKIFRLGKLAKATKGMAPKVAGAWLLVGGGIAAEKVVNEFEGEDYPMIMSGSDEVSMVDQSYTLLKVEDVENGAAETILTPSRIMTIVMFIFIMAGLIVPCCRLRKRIRAWITKSRTPNSRRENTPPASCTDSGRGRSEYIAPTAPTVDLEARERNWEQERIITAIADQTVKYNLGKKILEEEGRIAELEQEIKNIRTSRMTANE